MTIILRFTSVKNFESSAVSKWSCDEMQPGETVAHFMVEIFDWKLTGEIFENLPPCPSIDLITRSVNRGTRTASEFNL